MGNCFGEFDDDFNDLIIEFNPIINNKTYYDDPFILPAEENMITFGDLKEKLLDYSTTNENFNDFAIFTKKDNTKWKKRSSRKYTNFDFDQVKLLNKKTQTKFKFDVDINV